MKPIRSKMSQTEVVAELSETTGYPKTVIKEVLEAYKEVAKRHLIKGSTGEFSLLGIVKLDRVQRKSRQARNPRTGETIKVPAKRAIRAKVLGAAKNLEL